MVELHFQMRIWFSFLLVQAEVLYVLIFQLVQLYRGQDRYFTQGRLVHHFQYQMVSNHSSLQVSLL